MQHLDTRLSIASEPTSANQRRAAIVIAGLSLLLLAAIIPMARTPLTDMPFFIPAYQAAMIMNDIVTAALLFAASREVGKVSLLVLAGGYVCTATLILAHTISFPGGWGPTILGGSQTTAWLWLAWHTSFPAVVLIYAFTQDGPIDRIVPDQWQWRASTLASSVAMLLAGLCSGLAFAGSSWLPILVDDDAYMPGGTAYFVAIPLVPALLALMVLAIKTRLRSALHLWLAVAMLAWSIDVLLSAVFNTGRFQVGFYVGQTYGLLASGTVLLSLLNSTARLHQRLAYAFVHERLRADELERSQDALQQAQKMGVVGQLATGVASDFNNMLTGVVGALEMLSGGEVLSQRGKRVMALAQDQAARGVTLVDQLLAFARKQPLTREPIDVASLLHRVMGLLRATVGPAIRIDLASEEMVPPVLGDRTQIEVMLLNLVTNARDATPNGGAITLAISKQRVGEPIQPEAPAAGTYICLSVSDSGHGMAAEVRQRAFEPFFTTKPLGKASGLGLTHVLGVARQLGGGLEIETTAGKGCTVRLYLPIAIGATETAVKERLAPEDIPLHGTTILLVDDDDGVRDVTRVMLEGLGCKVIDKPSGPAAINLFTQPDRVRIDAALIDFAMPGMNGLETARRIANLRPGLPMLLATGYAEAATLKIAEPFAGLLKKPFRSLDLLEHVGPLVKQRIVQRGTAALPNSRL